jgi:hypothetical protein
MRHLFVAVTPVAFGEVVQARRVAAELVAGGDEVLFLAPAALQPALAGAPVRRGVLDRLGVWVLDEIVGQVAAAERCASVCLVDLAAVAQTCARDGIDLGGLVARAPAPVVALDLWSLGEGERVFDLGATRQPLGPEVLGIPRLVPVPLARPEVPEAYAAWPGNQPLAPEARAAVRRRLGVDAGSKRMVIMPSASWQRAAAQPDAATRASATVVPPLVLARLAGLDATLIHVGPERWAPDGPRYRHVAPLPPPEFERLVAAADRLLTLNISATSIATALAAGVPVVAVFSAGGPGVAPFRVWPLGLGRLLAPVLDDNPFLGCVRAVELFDEDGFAAALGDDERERERIAAYRARVAALPSAAVRYRQVTS